LAMEIRLKSSSLQPSTKWVWTENNSKNCRSPFMASVGK
jgi:hypothetical protein